MTTKSLYDLNVEIAALDRELRALDRANPEDFEKGVALVAAIRTLEEEYRTLRAATPRNYEGL